MSANLSRYATVCLSLVVAVGLFQSLLHFQLGNGFYTLPSMGAWILLVRLISLAASLYLLLYFRQRHYQLVFLTGILSSIATFGGFIFLWIRFLNPEVAPYSFGIFLLIIATNIVYAGSLILSPSSRHFWFKVGGFLTLGLGLMQMIATVGYMDIQSISSPSALTNLGPWMTLMSSLVPIPFILHFLQETSPRAVNEKGTNSFSFADALMGLVFILGLLILVSGVKLASESYNQLHITSKAVLLALPFKSGNYINASGDTLLYRLMEPLGYDPNKTYPLVVCLPYSCRQDNVGQVEACPPAQWLSKEQNRKKYPTFVFVPRCPPGTGWGGVAQTGSVDTLTIEAILALHKKYSIDPQRRYVTGVSRGGYGSWHFISTHPDLFAAAIPVCGAGNPVYAPLVTEVGVWAFHGAKDRNVPVEGSRAMITAIRTAGGHPRYTEFSGGGHSIWADVANTPGVLEWLFAQKKHQKKSNQ